MASEAGTHDTGRFGPYGGRYVPETLMAALEELDRVHEAAKRDPSFWAELDGLLKDYVGRPTPLTETPRLGAQVGTGVVVALKREDLNHTGAHKINNTLGQALLARRMHFHQDAQSLIASGPCQRPQAIGGERPHDQQHGTRPRRPCFIQLQLVQNEILA